MSWLMIAIDVVCSSVALLLISFSLFTLRTIRARGVKKTLWMPVLVSSVFFLIGNISSVLEDFMTISDELETLHHASWLVGLSILTYGIYTYLQMLRKISFAST